MGYPYPNFCLSAFLGPYLLRAPVKSSGFRVWGVLGFRLPLRVLGFRAFERFPLVGCLLEFKVWG